MAAQRRKEEAEAFRLATQEALISAPASPTKSSPQRIPSVTIDDADNDTDCHLLRLSPEIRSRIYYYAMYNDFHASLDHNRHRYPGAVKTRSKTPALMRTCSQLRTEGSIIWYSETVFIYKLDDVLYEWLKLIGPVNQKLVRTIRRDTISLTKRWAEAYVVFIHVRLRAQKITLAEDAIEVAFWETQAATPHTMKDTAADTALVTPATAALEQVFQSDDQPPGIRLIVGDGMTGGVFEFDPDLDLHDFAEKLLDNVHDACGEASPEIHSIRDDNSSIGDSRSPASSIFVCAKGDDGENKKKAKKVAKSSASSVSESTTSTKDAGKKAKADKKKKSSPSSLAESVMSTKSGKGDEPKDKKPTKPKVKKEPEPEKTWAFVRMETVTV